MTVKDLAFIKKNLSRYYPLELLALDANAFTDQFQMIDKAEVKMKRNDLIDQIIFHHYSEKTQFNLRNFLDKLERAVLIKTLSVFNGKQKDAAAFLDMNYTTLNEKIKRHKITIRKSVF